MSQNGRVATLTITPAADTHSAVRVRQRCPEGVLELKVGAELVSETVRGTGVSQERAPPRARMSVHEPHVLAIDAEGCLAHALRAPDQRDVCFAVQ